VVGRILTEAFRGICLQLLSWNQNSSVSIVTRLWSWQSGFISCGEQDIFFLKKVQTSSWAHAAY